MTVPTISWGRLLLLLHTATAAVLLRRDLSSYELARCNDGSTAAYYHQQDTRWAGRHVLIYLPDGGDCRDIETCRDRCREGSAKREYCTAPTQQVVERRDAIWSDNPLANPFADHFKVLLHYCSSDNFAGTRGASKATGNYNFHGKHIINALLDDLSLRFGLEKAASVTLVGTGSGAKGVGYNCDHVASLLPGVRVRCLADSPDIVPWWVRTDDCKNRDLDTAEAEKIFWGRVDDESCVEQNEAAVNSSELAHKCGVWSRYWPHITTPFFLVGSQYDAVSFESSPCTPNLDDPSFDEYELAWRRGTLALYESILASSTRADRGWYVPDCRAKSYLTGPQADSLLARLSIQDIDRKQNVSLSSSLKTWLGNSEALTAVHALDPLVAGNDLCGATAKLCASSCQGGRGYSSFPAVRRRLLPPSSLFPGGYERRCCVDPGWTGSGYGGSDLGIGLSGRGYLSGAGTGSGHVGSDLGIGLSGRGYLSGTGVDVGRRSRLWRRVLYLNYLKNLYRKHKVDYAREYYGHGTGLSPEYGLGVGLGTRGKIPVETSITDLLGTSGQSDYYDYGDYEDYSGLLGRIRSVVGKRKKGEEAEKSDKVKEAPDFEDEEDFGPLSEKVEKIQEKQI